MDPNSVTSTASDGVPSGIGCLREPVNALTHAAGVVLGAVGTVVLLFLADGDPWRTFSAVVYGLSMIVLYLASTLLHALRVGADTLRRLRILDHAAIFVLIAGSYTPIALVTLQESSPWVGWTVFAVVWGLATLGVLFKLVWIGAPRWISTGLYLGMGWLAVVAIGPLLAALPGAAIAWLVAGGVVYSLGAVVYATQRPDPFPNRFGYHEIWHLFVLAGSACHFVLIARYVVAT
ncbi:MAG: hemolysin III family protein [Trueperaceae bacterium]